MKAIVNTDGHIICGDCCGETVPREGRWSELAFPRHNDQCLECGDRYERFRAPRQMHGERVPGIGRWRRPTALEQMKDAVEEYGQDR